MAIVEDVADVDIIQRAVLFATKPSERRALKLECLRSWWDAIGVVLAFVGRSPRLSKILVSIFPALRKDARFRARSI